MNHFFADPSQLSDDKKTLTITGEDYNHIVRVLRMRPLEEISVSVPDLSEGTEYRYGIREITEDAVICDLRFIKEKSVELPANITLFQSLPKSDKMDFIVQKAVELGVQTIVPVAAARSVVKLDEKKALHKQERWQSIALSAARQSKRGIVPEVLAPVAFHDAVTRAETMTHVLMPYELAAESYEMKMEETKALIDGIRAGDSVGLFIGPEGGFEEAEVTFAMAHGVKAITLGRRILRTETAPLVVLSWLMLSLELQERSV